MVTYVKQCQQGKTSGMTALKTLKRETVENYDRRSLTKRLLQDRFPEALMRAVPDLCKVVTRADIKAADCHRSNRKPHATAQRNEALRCVVA